MNANLSGSRSAKRSQKKVIGYYNSFESRWGYSFFLWDTKHFAYYPANKKNISEKEAQVLYQDLVANNLKLHPTDTVLDAGCGRGVVTTYLAKKYKSKIIGIDLVDFELNIARKKAEALSVKNVNFHHMDYSNTTFANNFFDAIYTTETLSHSPDIRKTLKEFKRILKPGGRVAFFEYSIAPNEQFSTKEMEMLDIVIEGSAMMGLKEFRHDKFGGIIEDAGFKNVKEQNISENMRKSIYRLYKITRIPYHAVKLLKLQRQFVNITAGYECYKMADKGLLRYCIFTATK